MDARGVGLLVIAAGICAVVTGLLIYSGSLSWLGRLPGDIRYESERVHLYIPFTSMLLASLVLSLILYLLRRFF